MPEIHRFSDFADDVKIFEGDKQRVDDILNIEILIIDFRIKDSKYKEENYLTIQFEQEDEKFILFTGSKILMEQLEKYKSELPFYATIRKIDRYYTLT